MKSSTIKKILSVVFMFVGFVSCLLYAIYNSIYMDEYDVIQYDMAIVFGSLFEKYWPVLGIGLIMYFIVDKDK